MRTGMSGSRKAQRTSETRKAVVVGLLRVRSRKRDGVVCVVMPEVYRVIQIGSKSWAEPDEVITCIKEVLAYTGIL